MFEVRTSPWRVSLLHPSCLWNVDCCAKQLRTSYRPVASRMFELRSDGRYDFHMRRSEDIFRNGIAHVKRWMFNGFYRLGVDFVWTAGEWKLSGPR